MLTSVLFLISVAAADEAGDTWLARIDKTARVDDAHLVLDVEVTDAKGRTNPRTIEIWQKGDERRLVRMVAPARLAGIGLLVSPGEKTHLYLPQYPPARLVVGSKRADAFMGTDFAIEDLSRLTYADTYNATVSGSEDGLTKLVLTHKTDKKATPTHLWVDDEAIVRRVAHLDAKGKTKRALEMADVREVENAKLPHHIRVTDTKRGRVTEARIQQISVGSGIDDAMFSVTQLERR
jgi:outer membrane lipoprotein-sorting protein